MWASFGSLSVVPWILFAQSSWNMDAVPSYTIPSQSLSLGIAPAGTDASNVSFGTPGAVKDDGSFTAEQAALLVEAGASSRKRRYRLPSQRRGNRGIAARTFRCRRDRR